MTIRLVEKGSVKTQDQKGFTIIEIMVVVSIVGVLSTIAIQSFLSYRAKSFCSVVESDANNAASAIADYFAIPARTQMDTATLNTIFTTSPGNTISVSGPNLNGIITIQVRDTGRRCPEAYRDANVMWDNNYTYTKVVKIR